MTEAEFLAAANERLQKLSYLLRSSTNDGFHLQFSSVPNVSLDAAEYHIAYSQTHICLQMELVIDYGTFLATARPRRKLAVLPSTLDSELLEQILQKTIEMAPTWIRQAFDGLPRMCVYHGGNRCSSGAFVSASRKWIRRDCDGKTLPEFLSAVFAEVQPEMEETCRNRLQSEMEQKLAPFSDPPHWLRVGSLRSLSITFSVSDANRLECSARYRYSLQEPATVSLSGPDIANAAESEPLPSLREYIVRECRAFEERLVAELVRAFLPCTVIPPTGANAGNGFPPDLWSFLLSGRAETPCCTLVSDFCLSSVPGKVPADKEMPSLGLLAPDLPVVGSKPPEYETRLGLSFIGQEQDARPDSLYGSLLFFHAAAARYQSMDLDIRPRLWFFVRSGIIHEIQAQDLCGMCLPNPPADPWPSFSSFCNRIQRRTWELAHEKEARAKVLAGLNPTVLAILQYIYRKKSVRYQAIADDLGPDLITTKVTIQHYLYDACQVEVPAGNVFARVIRQRYARGHSCRDQQSALYEPALPKLRKEILAAKPAPFGIEDFPNLTPNRRAVWLRETAERADTKEKLWELLDILEKHLPKTTAAAFVKSETGQACLKRLQDEDREYARLLLEDLPGCKKLVSSLLGQKDEGS